MVTTPADVVPITSIDNAGVSTATTSPSLSDPRAGSIYNPAILAAAQPVWFHPLRADRYIMVMSRIWTAGTPVSSNPGLYSVKTESLAASWAMIAAQGGTYQGMPNGLSIPSVPVDATLVAGASRPTEMMWLLYSVDIGATNVGYCQFYNISDNGTVTLTSATEVPSTATVVFDKGIQYASPFLYFYGTDSGGTLHRCRKGWGRIGGNDRPRYGLDGSPGMDWEYYTGTGWSKDPAELAPVQPGMTSVGPVSFGYWRNMVVMSVVEAASTTRTARFWVSKAGRTWSRTGNDIVLGTTGTTYLGGGVTFQPQLAANPESLPSNSGAGIPYVWSSKVISGGNQRLQNTWGLYQVLL